MIKFTIPGQPKPQGRPRFFRRGNFVGTYDPKDSASYKDKIAHYAKLAGATPLLGPVRLVCKFVFQRPKSLMKKKSPEGFMQCVKRPDADNLAKAVMDGLIAISWIDDSQIVQLDCQKLYCEKIGVARTEVFYEEIFESSKA